MKITFIIPKIEILGGTRVIFEYAYRLQNRGHDVSIIYPLIPIVPGAIGYNTIRNLFKKIRRILRTAIYQKQNDTAYRNIKINLVRVPLLIEKYIPNADIVVATWWKTAYYVSRYDKNKGEKFYLIQHYEIWEGQIGKVNGSYKLGLKNIVISTWLKNILQNKLGACTEALIFNGVDLKKFYPENIKRKDNTIRILTPYRSLKWKGTGDAIRAFEIVQGKHPNIKLVMFGQEIGKNIPPHTEFHRSPTDDELRRIYNSCDIFLFPSHNEGFGLPPMEAMACKIPVATTNVGAVPDYAISGETALISPPNDTTSLANNISRLIDDEKERKRIAENGYDYIKQFTWDKATDELEKVFKRSIGEK